MILHELCTYHTFCYVLELVYLYKFQFQYFRIKCTYRWCRRFLTLSRNKWTFKLQPRVPPVVGARPLQWPPITDATTRSCRFATNSCHYIFVFASTRTPHVSRTLLSRNYATTLNSCRKLPAMGILPQGNHHN